MSAGSSSTAPRTGNPELDQTIAQAIRQAEQLGGIDVTKSVRTVGRVVKVVVFLVVLGVIVSVAKPVIDVGQGVRDAVEDIPSPGEIADDVSPPSASEPAKGAAVPVGLSRNSMLTRRNFDSAMDRLSTSGLGRLRTLSVRPERIDAQLLTKGGSLRSVQIRSDDPEINDFGAGSSGFSHLETIPFSSVNTGAPARLARSAAGRSRKPVSQIDYVALLSFAGKPVWTGFVKGGGQYLANSRGRITRRIN